MQIYKGVTAQSGAAYGIIKIKGFDSKTIKPGALNSTGTLCGEIDIHAERSRFLLARVKVDDKLRKLCEKTLETIGEKEAQIFDVERMVLKDEGFTSSVLYEISRGVDAATAVMIVSESLVQKLDANANEFFHSRCEDIYDIRDLLVGSIRSLDGDTPHSESEKRHILVADNVSATEMMNFDFRKVRGIVLRHGSIYSHAAIIARSRRIPMIVNCDFPGDFSVAEFPAVLLAGEGKLFISPDGSTLARFSEQKMMDLGIIPENSMWHASDEGIQDLFANAGCIEDVNTAMALKAKGIGLFRTEFLYLTDRTPSEEEQFEVYKKVLKKAKGRPVVFRTADFGDDKLPLFLPAHDGLRGISYSLCELDIFITQIRALLRASHYGNLSIMFPMITSVEEVEKTLSIITQVDAEIRKTGLPVSNSYKIGAMIETPEAVEISDKLANMVDFFSIGTNDLSRFVLSVDRNQMSTQDLEGDNRDKLMNYVRKIVKSAHDAEITVSVCGELAADADWAVDFKTAGVDELSVSV